MMAVASTSATTVLCDLALLDHRPTPSPDALRLRELRLQAQLTQEEFAIQLSVARETVTRWEACRWRLPPTVLLAAHHVVICGGLSCACAIATSS
jgi:DNA-binding transcriptional regulator YiaG